MFHKDNMKKWLQKEIKGNLECDVFIMPKQKKIPQETPKIQQSNKPTIYVPRQQDTLFWCYYIMKNGDAAYETLNNKNFLVAKQMKIELVYTIRKHKDILKMYKFDTLVGTENNLANEDTLNLPTFLSLCAIENRNVVFVNRNKNLYYELLMNNTETTYIVYEMEPLKSNASNHYKKPRYGFEIATEVLLKGIREKYYLLENIHKPIKAISAYKTDDLYMICSKIGVDITNPATQKKKSKKDLYEELVVYFL